jgi:hypothetical protein
MADEDNVIDPPEEAHDPALSSAAKDAFFANDPNASGPSSEEPPEEHKHRTYDVKARGATSEDADFEADAEAAAADEENNDE